jgi:hypothetical protein
MPFKETVKYSIVKGILRNHFGYDIYLSISIRRKKILLKALRSSSRVMDTISLFTKLSI